VPSQAAAAASSRCLLAACKAAWHVARWECTTAAAAALMWQQPQCYKFILPDTAGCQDHFVMPPARPAGHSRAQPARLVASSQLRQHQPAWAVQGAWAAHAGSGGTGTLVRSRKQSSRSLEQHYNTWDMGRHCTHTSTTPGHRDHPRCPQCCPHLAATQPCYCSVYLVPDHVVVSRAAACHACVVGFSPHHPTCHEAPCVETAAAANVLRHAGRRSSCEQRYSTLTRSGSMSVHTLPLHVSS
jgi:hypothetical protein